MKFRRLFKKIRFHLSERNFENYEDFPFRIEDNEPYQFDDEDCEINFNGYCQALLMDIVKHF